MIKFWAFIYRLTGWYSPWARLAEYRAIRKLIAEKDWRIDDEFANNSLEIRLGIEIGCWQAHHGFYRTFKVRRK